MVGAGDMYKNMVPVLALVLARLTAELRFGINFRKFGGFCHQFIWVPPPGSAPRKMPIFSGSVKVMQCSGCAVYLSVRM